MIKIKSIKEKVEFDDGYRILVEGVVESSRKFDLDLTEVAPSQELKKWFRSNPKKWSDFKRKYKIELTRVPGLLEVIRKIEKGKGTVTLVYQSKDAKHSMVAVLLEILGK